MRLLRLLQGRKPPADAAVRVNRAEARVGDEVALARLLSALPEGGELRPRLSQTFFGRAWHRESERDFWVVSDGSRVSCFTIEGLTLRQAAAVRVRWDAHSTNGVPLTEKLLKRVISDVLNET